jgi:hypothetical protein
MDIALQDIEILSTFNGQDKKESICQVLILVLR